MFLASSGSFTVKNDNIHKFGICKTKIHGSACLHGNSLYCKILTRKNQSEHRDLLKTGFAIIYNNALYKCQILLLWNTYERMNVVMTVRLKS